MTTFIGDFPCKIDEKGRLAFPSAFLKQLGEAEEYRFVVKKDIFETCLVLYTMEEWQRQTMILRSKLNPYKKEHNTFLRTFYKGTAEVVLDKNNRLLLPKRLSELAQIDKEALLAGQDNKIEIWSKELYDQIFDDDDLFAEMAEKILGNDVATPETLES